jgi:hypothetical protein
MHVGEGGPIAAYAVSSPAAAAALKGTLRVCYARRSQAARRSIGL